MNAVRNVQVADDEDEDHGRCLQRGAAHHPSGLTAQKGSYHVFDAPVHSAESRAETARPIWDAVIKSTALLSHDNFRLEPKLPWPTVSQRNAHP